MVLGYHLILSAYGFWLPNDPRGSWSEFVGAWDLVRFGRATKTEERRSVAHRPHDAARRLRAKAALRYPPVEWTGLQARAIGRGFGTAVAEGGYPVHACAVLPDHAHVVICRHERRIEQIAGHLKARATQRLMAEGLWPDRRRPVWARKSWSVFLDESQDVRRAIRYVEQNPEREGKRPQTWTFVAPYAG